MTLPHQQLHQLTDAQENFEALQSLLLNLRVTFANGAPAGMPTDNKMYYFRLDTPGTANQRLYVWNGTTWTGIV